MPTIYRPVPGFDDLYAGMDGTIVHGGKGRELVQTMHKGQRYVRVNVPRVGMRKVHQLVAAAFLGPQPDGMETRHGPGGKQDNSIGNLCYGTRQDNAQDAIHYGEFPNANKTECPQGHRYTPENTYNYRGGRRCRTCQAIQVKKNDMRPEVKARRLELQRARTRRSREG